MNDLLVKILEGTTGMTEEQEIFKKCKTIIAEHFSVSEDVVEWRSFKKEGWHIDPPGRWYVDGKLLKFKLTPFKENEE